MLVCALELVELIGELLIKKVELKTELKVDLLKALYIKVVKLKVELVELEVELS
jgi:hypothetical protein